MIIQGDSNQSVMLFAALLLMSCVFIYDATLEELFGMKTVVKKG
jgi:hypothetical protein